MVIAVDLEIEEYKCLKLYEDCCAYYCVGISAHIVRWMVIDFMAVPISLNLLL